MKKEERYLINYEYRDTNGRFIREERCNVYTDYHKADADLSDKLSELESKGYTEVQGYIREI